jgi:predicted secreted hydrolase
MSARSAARGHAPLPTTTPAPPVGTRAGLAALTAVALLVGCADGPQAARARLSLTGTLAGEDTAGYARATTPRPFVFPADHGPHPDFRSEWWYVTGNLAAADGRDFGFQLTIFRSALSPVAPASESAWATRQAYMAHFTVTDVTGRSFHAYERFARGAVGLAGASADPFRVWLEDWVIEGEAASTFPLRLQAAGDGAALRLRLRAGKPVVSQGEDGLSRKGPEEGNASYYYSLTRLPAEGSLVLDGDTLAVSGSAWLDREWSTSALGEDMVGWDWFALQLSDGWDLMIYRLRRADGSATPESAGVLVDPDGGTVPLAWGTDVTVDAVGTWTSPLDGARYPSGWRLAVPARGWSLAVEPRLPDQELDLSFRYWEGAVSVEGTGEAGRPVSGRGYVELTGYAGAAPGR